MTKKLLTVENIRSGAVPSDAVAVGFLLGEIERLEKAKSAFAHDAAMYASRLPRVHEPLEQRLSPRAMVAIDANAQPAGGAESTAEGSTNAALHAPAWEKHRNWRHELTFNVYSMKELQKIVEEIVTELDRVTWELHLTRPGACTECWGFNGGHQPHSCKHWTERASRDAQSVTPVPGYRVFDEVSDVPAEVWSASRDADHCDYPDCEQHWTNVVAQARAILEPLAEHDPAIRQWLRIPDLPKLSGASRDASNHDQGSLTEAGCSPAAQSCEWTATAGNPDDDSQRTGPADLVGALQDVVHTDPGPVRAGKASRSGSTTSIPCIYRDGCRKFPACMIEARCCGNDAAIPSTR